jgi:hypothetical protein
MEQRNEWDERSYEKVGMLGPRKAWDLWNYEIIGMTGQR